MIPVAKREDRKAPPFGAYLRDLRKRAGLTLRQVEGATGISNSYLSQVELEKRPAPRPDTLKKLAEAYRVPVEELLAAAGYLEPLSVSKEREVDRAFEFVVNDPNYQFGFKLRGKDLTQEVKRFVVEMYEKATRKRLL